MLEVICCGNPSKDRINFNGKVSLQQGGPSYFIAKALRDSNIACGILGKAEREFKKVLQSKGVDVQGIQESETMSEIEIQEFGEKTTGRIIAYAGTIDVNKVPAGYKDAPFAVISTILDEIPLNYVKFLKDQKKVVAVDLQGYLRCKEKECDSYLSSIDYLKVSESEAYRLTKESELKRSVKCLRKKTKGGTIIMTRGDEGLELISPNGVVHLRTTPVHNVHTVGAGDMLFGSFIGSIYQGLTSVDAAKKAQEYVQRELEKRI